MAVSRAAAALAVALTGLAASRLRRYEIAEGSMSPALEPGDYVVAVRRPRRVRPGDVVIFDHPERKGFTLVKRVAAASGAAISVRGDNRAASSDVGPIALTQVEARVAWVYWPPTRFGRVAR